MPSPAIALSTIKPYAMLLACTHPLSLLSLFTVLSSAFDMTVNNGRERQLLCLNIQTSQPSGFKPTDYEFISGRLDKIHCSQTVSIQ